MAVTGDRLNPILRTPSQIRRLIGRIAERLRVLDEHAGNEIATFDSNTLVGQPLYAKASGNVDLADASAISTAEIVGLAYEDASATEDKRYTPDGRITLDDWTNVVGSTNLTPGAVYFLSATAGQLTTTAPTVVGEIVVRVGKALSTTTFDIEIGPTILL